MEIIGAFVSAIATAAVTTAVSKLTTVNSCEVKVQRQVGSLKTNLGSIKALLAQFGGKRLSVSQTNSLEQLRCFACEIEDCVDLFHAGNTDGFADEIDHLKNKSVEVRIEIKDFLKIEHLLGTGSSEGAVQTTQLVFGNLDITQGAAVGARAPVVPIPTELQDLLDDQTQKDWLAKNIEYFLYFCFFPPEHPVSTNLLKRTVLAEGLVKADDGPSNEKTIDNVADDILEKLVKAKIISSTQRSIDGKVEICQHTKRMHECISEKSKLLKFLLVCDGNTRKTEFGEASRISVHSSENVQQEWPKYLPRLRTLGVFPADNTDATANSYKHVLDFARYKVLRVLDLKEFAHLTDNHLDDIVVKPCQKLMKYLSLNLGKHKGISQKISNLNQLETLDLSGNDTLTLFQEVLFLPNLKHLLGKYYLSRSEFYKDHSELEEFLANNSKLETLDGFVTSTRYGFQDVMGLIRTLSKVKMWCTGDSFFGLRMNVVSDAIRKFVGKSTDQPHCNRSLSIDFTKYNSNWFTAMEKVKDNSLDSLELNGELTKFPQFVSGLSNMVELCLRSTGQTWVAIRCGLRNVKGLKSLMLVEEKLGHFNFDKIPPEKAAPGGNGQAVEELKDDLRSIQRISVESSQRVDITIPDDALPLLVSLRILCKALDVSPATSCIKISHMEKLEEIALHHEVKAEIRTQWENAASDHPHQLQVRIT